MIMHAALLLHDLVHAAIDVLVRKDVRVATALLHHGEYPLFHVANLAVEILVDGLVLVAATINVL